MYNAVIDNGSTYLFLDNGSEDVYSGDMSGFLINNNNIINLMEALPIKQYYLRTKDRRLSSDLDNKKDQSYFLAMISKEQAYYLYQQLIDYNSQKENLNKKI